MLLNLVLAATQAHAGGLVQVGTGLRPLSLGGTNTVFGGGLRAGPTFGAFTPFAGATALFVSGQADEDARVAGSSWSALAGLRVDLADLDRLAQPFVSAGALIGLSTLNDGEAGTEIDLQVGPGAFAGFGADAKLSPAVRIGLEVGVVVSAASGTVLIDDESERASGTASWSYADLHVVFRPGKSK
jgi:hypothetical protein